MNAPGKGILKVVSILFIIFGAFAVIVSLIGLFGASVLTAVTLGLGGIFVVATVIALIASAAELVIGILGVKKCEDPSQAMFFIVTGFILCALQLVSMIMFLSITGFSFTSFIGFVLPVLFIVGGFKNKNAVLA